MIRVKDVWKSYNSVPVLKGLSLEIPSKQTTIILGRSGVGKSVLLKQIAGIETPERGSIEINGIELSSLPQKERTRVSSQVGMLFQGSALFDSMNIFDNIAFALVHRHRLSKQEILEQVEQSLFQVGLPGFEEKYPSELSGGQKRRAALARLLVYKPSFLLFDEPTTGLDPITAGQIISLIEQTQKNLEATSVIVTHDLVLAMRVGSYFALHEQGVIRVSGNKKEFFANPEMIIQEFISQATLPIQEKP